MVAIGAALGCRADPGNPCPSGYSMDLMRAAIIAERLRRTTEGEKLLPRGSALPETCFGPAAVSMITTEGTLLLDRRLDDFEAAARVGHLLTHRADGLGVAEFGLDCDAEVTRALRLEARALALELRLRRVLGGSRVIAYEFETPFWEAQPDAREALIFDYLRTHRDGAPGVDALASGYLRRCNEARAR